MASFDGAEYLKTFLNWESKLHQAASGVFLLERMERLLTVFGRPDANLRFAHVAGTKGKGSTCAFLASILRAAGYRVGLYTSPHLYSVCERIRILEPRERKSAEGQDPLRPLAFEGAIPWQAFEDILRYYHDDIEKLRTSGVEITFYELITAVAVHYFASQKVDIVVLETGLGGRLDATNVFDTSVCGITPIGFDHMNILGNTIEAIAAEKAGIIKLAGQRVALAPQPVAALRILQERCAEFYIQPMIVGCDVPCTVHEVLPQGVFFEVEGRRRYEELFSPLPGAHQAENAALAIAMAEDLETFGYVINEDVVRRGIAEVVWPARFEKVGEKPIVILDCAHTAESAKALADTFQAAYPARKAVIVLGMSMDKDVTSFVQTLAPVTQTMVLTKADHPRAMDFSVAGIKEKLPGVDVVLEPRVSEALHKARTIAGDDGIILVTGSVFVCAEASYVSI
ncbi:MAG: bifunctional folylpolyglutamate synthase/dihydrofolate synthase [Candidatus Omnitrophica bacterium]|nr:bifunctional folylpolyglutamate synthase/dihydrofolate synthase [Candidatus Omnitrophota bacterium]